MSIPVIGSNLWNVKVVLRMYKVLGPAFKKTNIGVKWLALWRFLIRTRTEMFCYLIQLSCQTAAYSLNRCHKHLSPCSLQLTFYSPFVTWCTNSLTFNNCTLCPHCIYVFCIYHRVLVGKPEGKRPLGRPRRRWEDNIKMDLQEVGGSCGDWMELVQDRDRWRALVGTVRNFRVPKMRGISWLAAEQLASQEGLRSME